jgi:hypothetical protein
MPTINKVMLDIGNTGENEWQYITAPNAASAAEKA